MKIYDFAVKGLNGQDVSLNLFSGKVLLVEYSVTLNKIPDYIVRGAVTEFGDFNEERRVLTEAQRHRG
jgi:hypothetical protein